MTKFLSLDIGVRYLRSRQTSLLFVTRITTIGLVLAIAVLLVFQSVMSGFQRSLEERILSIVPHFSLISSKSSIDTSRVDALVEEIDGIEAWAAVAENTVLLVGSEKIAGIRLLGIDPQQYEGVSQIAQFADEGMSSLKPGTFNIVLGDDAAKRLDAEIGDSITVIFPQANFTPLGVFPRRKNFEIVAVFDSKSLLDRGAGITHIQDAREMLRIQGVANTLHFRTSDPDEAQYLALLAWQYFDDQDVYPLSWRWSYGVWHNILQNVKNIFFLIMSLLVAVAAFNLVSALVILVHERKGDIAILRTMGGNTALVTVSFMLTAAAIALIGIVFGTATAWVLGTALEWSFPYLTDLLGMNLLGEFILQDFSVDFNLNDIAKVTMLSLILAVLASLYPAWRATHTNPAEILQHE